MTPNERLIAASLADRLIYGSETTFHGEDAAELMRLIPAPSLWSRLMRLLPSLSMRGKVPGQGFQGAAAGGHGSVRMEGADQSFEFDSRGLMVSRAGQWKIARTDGVLAGVLGRASLEITQVMSEAQDEQTALVTFARGIPLNMRRFVGTPINLGPVTVTASLPRRWKAPVFGQRLATDPHDAGRGAGHSGHAFSAA